MRWQDKSVSVEAPQDLYIVDNESMQSAQYDDGLHQPSFSSFVNELDMSALTTQESDQEVDMKAGEQASQTVRFSLQRTRTIAPASKITALQTLAYC